MSKRKNELKQKIKDLETKWSIEWENFQNIASKGVLKIKNLESIPHIVASRKDINLYFIGEEGDIPNEEYTQTLIDEYNRIKDLEIPTVKTPS